MRVIQRSLRVTVDKLDVAGIARPDSTSVGQCRHRVAIESKTRHQKGMEQSPSYLLRTKDLRLKVQLSTIALTRCTKPKRLFVCTSTSDLDSGRKSRSGVWQGINKCPTRWLSKKQTTVADLITAEETSLRRQICGKYGRLQEIEIDGAWHGFHAVVL